VFRSIADGVLGFFESILEFLHRFFEPVFGVHSWGWAIIGLTVIVRVVLLPLAVKQTRSMRATQRVQPLVREIQKKYKVDRDLMKKDPEQYRKKRQKLNEEMMALYKREGVNPAASCLPLLAQAPIFLALFWTLNRSDDLAGAPFYFITSATDGAREAGLAALASAAGWTGWLLIILMSGTLFLTQKQMIARTAAQNGDEPNPMAQQQKILMYVLPVFLAVISFRFPLGILLYWVTTNIWQVAQQAVILREVKAVPATGELPSTPSPEEPRRRSPGASSGKQEKTESTDEPDLDATDESPRPERSGEQDNPGKSGTNDGDDTVDPDHLPRRRRRRDDRPDEPSGKE
jgi:YidC/Oxa1 family membrane protein insertase